MLGSHAHRKGFGLHLQPHIVQQTIGVARTVSYGQHGVPGGIAPLGGQNAHPVGHGFQPHYRLAEMHLAAQRLDLLPYALDHHGQAVGAHVWMGVVQNTRIGPVAHKGLEHVALHEFVPRARIEFAIRKSARSPFAKLHVAAGVQHALLPKTCYHGRARIHVVAALEHDGTQARLGQHVGAHHTRGAKADHDGTTQKGRARGGTIARDLLHLARDTHRIGQTHLLFARVDATPQHHVGFAVAARDARLL